MIVRNKLLKKLNIRKVFYCFPFFLSIYFTSNVTSKSTNMEFKKCQIISKKLEKRY